MGEDSEPLTTEDSRAPGISHRRLLIEMAIVLMVGSAAGYAFFGATVGSGVLIGGVLAFANYYWQKNSLRAIFDRAAGGDRPRFLALRYILRYVVIGGILGIIYLTQTVSIFGVIFGLASFSLAVMIEGMISIFWNRQES